MNKESEQYKLVENYSEELPAEAEIIRKEFEKDFRRFNKDMDDEWYMLKSRESVREAVENTFQSVKELWELKPKYIFLNETSAVPDGFAFKEAWEEAYGRSDLPVFLRIDPRKLMELRRALDENKDDSFGEHAEKIEIFLRDRIKDRSGLIYIYDEDSRSGRSPGIVADLLTNPEKFGLSAELKCSNVKRTRGSMENGYAGNIFGPALTRSVTTKTVDVISGSGKGLPAIEDFNLTGDIGFYSFKWDIGEFRRNVKEDLEFIKGFKAIGKLAGQRIKAEMEQNK